MFQLFLPGFEGTLPFEIACRAVYNIEETIDYFELRGFDFLIDWTPQEKGECYVPERFVSPSGFILDEEELLESLESKQNSEKRRETTELYYYYLAVRHTDNTLENIINGRYSFLDDSDMINSFNKYGPAYNNP